MAFCCTFPPLCACPCHGGAPHSSLLHALVSRRVLHLSLQSPQGVRQSWLGWACPSGWLQRRSRGVGPATAWAVPQGGVESALRRTPCSFVCGSSCVCLPLLFAGPHRSHGAIMGTPAAHAAVGGARALGGGAACQRMGAGGPPPPVGTVLSRVQQPQAAGVPQLGVSAFAVRVGAPPVGRTPGAGPTSAPPPPSPAAVWVDGSWVLYIPPPPPQPTPQALQHQPPLQPQPAQQQQQRRHAAPRAPQQPGWRSGYTALLFCPARALSLASGGAPLRMLLSLACSSSGSLATGLGDAFAALAMSKVVWLGDVRAPAHVRCPTALRFGAVPGRFVAALLQHYGAVRAVLRREHGWRMVLLEDGQPLPLPSADAGAVPGQHSNRFATLAACAPGADPSSLHG